MEQPKSNKHDRHEVYRSAVGSNFTVQTEDEKLAAKLARKERKKHGGRDEGEIECHTVFVMLAISIEKIPPSIYRQELTAFLFAILMTCNRGRSRGLFRYVGI